MTLRSHRTGAFCGQLFGDAFVGGVRRFIRFDTGSSGDGDFFVSQSDQFFHRERAGKREQLLVHCVEEPAESGNDEDEPVVAVKFAIPWSGPGIGGMTGIVWDVGVHANVSGSVQSRIRGGRGGILERKLPGGKKSLTVNCVIIGLSDQPSRLA